ncbi:MAG: hypothetical protein ACRD3O_04110 [Terriglobia bacterium]
MESVAWASHASTFYRLAAVSRELAAASAVRPGCFVIPRLAITSVTVCSA